MARSVRQQQGKRKSAREGSAVAETEAALRAAHGKRHARREEGHAFLPKGTYGRAMERAAPFVPEEEEAPFGLGVPHTRSSDRRSRVGKPEAALPPGTAKLVRGMAPLFRLLGDAARAVDEPIRRALETLQRLGHEARRAG
jgi:hypothetical protein